MGPDAEPVWHTTETVDYDIVLSGELVLMLDAGEVTLHPGDVVIQRNTAHAWRNPTNAPVHWVAVLVPAQEGRVGLPLLSAGMRQAHWTTEGGVGR